MSTNSMLETWQSQINSEEAVTEAQLKFLKERFSVKGAILPIDGSPGYAVSDDGRVFTYRLLKRDKTCPRELRMTVTGYGYHMVRLQINRKESAQTVHRLVAHAFLPKPEPHQTMVRHLDGNPANNNVANLAWGTQSDNMQDAVRHGRTLKGRKNPNAKLTDSMVVAIRLLEKEGYSCAALADFLGMHEATVYRAVKNDQWRHVNDPESCLPGVASGDN